MDFSEKQKIDSKTLSDALKIAKHTFPVIKNNNLESIVAASIHAANDDFTIKNLTEIFGVKESQIKTEYSAIESLFGSKRIVNMISDFGKKLGYTKSELSSALKIYDDVVSKKIFYKKDMKDNGIAGAILYANNLMLDKHLSYKRISEICETNFLTVQKRYNEIKNGLGTSFTPKNVKPAEKKSVNFPKRKLTDKDFRSAFKEMETESWNNNEYMSTN